MNIRKKFAREYRIWKNMRARCSAPCFSHLNYQKNNIKVCADWDSFEKFLEDMGPSNGLSIDRIDNLSNYCKDNCRWTNSIIQSSNRSSFNIEVKHNNETKTLKQWAKDLGIKYSTLYHRYKIKGMSFEQAINKDPYRRLIEFNGKKQILKEWCTELGLKYSTVACRISDGWTYEKALSTPTPPIKI